MAFPALPSDRLEVSREKADDARPPARRAAPSDRRLGARLRSSSNSPIDAARRTHHRFALQTLFVRSNTSLDQRASTMHRHCWAAALLAVSPGAVRAAPSPMLRQLTEASRRRICSHRAAATAPAPPSRAAPSSPENGATSASPLGPLSAPAGCNKLPAGCAWRSAQVWRVLPHRQEDPLRGPRLEEPLRLQARSGWVQSSWAQAAEAGRSCAAGSR